MKLSDNIVQQIKDEYIDWVDKQYSGKDLKERQALGQFYTPPELSVKMLEKYDDLEGNILDPTCGAGGLLAAAVIAGANPRHVYGIELDAKIVKICRDRLAGLGVPRWNIKQGDALVDESYEFSTEHQDDNWLYFNVKDLGFSKVEIELEVVTGKTIRSKAVVDFTSDEEVIRQQLEKIYSIFSLIDKKGLILVAENMTGKLKLLVALFKKYLKKSLDIPEEKKIEL